MPAVGSLNPETTPPDPIMQTKPQTRTWYIHHRRAGATNLGNTVTTPFQGTYNEAVHEAHRVFQAMPHKVLVTLHGDSACLHWYHWIGTKGEVMDRNINGGAEGYPTSYATRYSIEQNSYVAA